MRRDHRDYLNDIVAYAELAVEIAASGDERSVLADRVRVLALERAFEVVGEAAGKVPPSVRDRYADVPWAQMVALRNRLTHAYFGIDAARLYFIASELLPKTLARAREIARLEGADRPPGSAAS